MSSGKESDESLMKSEDREVEFIGSNQALAIDPDKVLIAFGTFGRYQILNCMMVVAPLFLYASTIMVMPFLTEEDVEFTCAIQPGYKRMFEVVDSCTVRETLSGLKHSCLSLIGTATAFNYGNASVDATLVSAFNLVCEDSSKRDHISATYLFGSMCGASIFSQLSDKLGRKKTFLISLWMALCSSILLVWVPNYYLFIVFQFLSGVGMGGNIAIGYCMCNEVVSPSMREYTPFITNFFWIAGYVWAGVARMKFVSWTSVYMAAVAPGLFSLVYTCTFPESLHWMVTNRKTNLIRKYIHTATRVNGMAGIDLHECRSARHLSDQDLDSVGISPLATILRNWKVCYQFAVAATLMAVMNMTYWALSLFSKDLSDDKTTGFFLSALVEIPAAVISVILLKLMNRRPVSCLMFILTSFCLLATAYIPAYLSGESAKAAALILPLLAKMFNSIVWAVLPLAMSEMIPTVIRNSFTGGVSFIGDVGSVVSPYLELLNTFGPNTAALLITWLSAGCALLVMTMPETKGSHLGAGMETFNEGEFVKMIVRTCGGEEKQDDDDDDTKYIPNGQLNTIEEESNTSKATFSV